MQYFYRSYLLLTFLIFNIVIIKAQPPGFEHVYTFFNGQAGATTIYNTENGYLMGGFDTYLYTKIYFLLNIDKNGNPVKILKIPVRDQPHSSPVLINTFLNEDSAGNYTLTTTAFDGSSLSKIRLYYLDNLGEILLKKTFELSYHANGITSFINIKNNSFYVFGQYNESTENNLILIRTDTNGEILNQYQYELTLIPGKGYVIRKYKDKGYLIGGNSKILLINFDGDIIWQEDQVQGINELVADENGNIYVGHKSGLLTRLDQNGNLSWTANLDYQIHSIALLNDGFLITQSSETGPLYDFVTKTDKEGNIIWRKTVNETGEVIIPTTDGGFITAGSTNRYPWVFKSDSLGFNNYLCLISPYNLIPANKPYRITWLSRGQQYLDIDYSMNGGGIWNNIIKSVPAEDRNYIWDSPSGISENCLLRIRDNSDYTISAVSDSVFTIAPYNGYDYLAANEVRMWVGNNGDGSHNPITDGQGMLWPGGENATGGAVFEDGLIWSGNIEGELRVGGSTYRHGLQPGNIPYDGRISNPDEYRFQVWKLKKNWESLPDGIEKEKYRYNYDNWPVDLGAPWSDQNRDNEYTTGIDYPLYYGDEMLFNAANDFDSTLTQYLYGSNPLGIEMQCISFALDTTNGINNAVFKKYKLINKGNNEIKNMYLSYWTDDDLGDASDDYIGVDTTLNLGYTWNGTNDDGVYGSPPPAVGHMIIQGPKVPALPDDSARFGNGWINGFTNMKITSFGPNFKNASAYSHDPPLGIYQGTIETHNLMLGLTNEGDSLINPLTGNPTSFPLAGDPVSGTGWYEGSGWPGGPIAADRRYYLTCGPFDLAPGDTQEIAVAIFIERGSNNVQGIQLLRETAVLLQNYYDNKLVKELITTLPDQVINYSLEQNYPNPFNSITNIEYTLPVKSRVTIKIYDILGREVKVFNQGEQVPWQYRVSFNASAFASGVYIYRIEAVPVNGQGDPSTGSGQGFIQTKKMVLLK